MEDDKFYLVNDNTPTIASENVSIEQIKLLFKTDNVVEITFEEYLEYNKLLQSLNV